MSLVLLTEHRVYECHCSDQQRDRGHFCDLNVGSKDLGYDLAKFRLFRQEPYLGAFLSGFPVLPTVTVTSL